ncbi:hypothetical protein G5B88_09195 [Herbaspirillum seropedicae]|uniref:Uncharacterized protein n=1 Tax=Herbaspirillum seropedicae (strain SmR1) TaxID=757424 RepID=D8IRL3_HERSS|nr:hypothetical protein [Herbaspirillum seropedicae]ADJ63337.1 hypothetical protein Hsero_1827 [Herbaspirillum seropedicae SmR1]NQE28534.1 hypothetical protein [Herbaspirillum seropedicae]UMU21341.1 hypothetical protein G5B88_09195 [Herbaspirillum seropedicae]
MGSRHEFSEDVANFHWGTGTWTDLFYHGHGTISVGASAYQSEAVKLWSDYRVRYIEMGFRAWGVFLSGCADSSSIDVYGLAWVDLTVTGGNQHIDAASPGTVTIRTAEGDDTIGIHMGGRHTDLKVGDGRDVVHLSSGWDTDLTKGDGYLWLDGSHERAGWTAVNAGLLHQGGHFESRSTGNTILVKRADGAVFVDIYGVGSNYYAVDAGTGNHTIRVASPGTNKVFTADGDDDVTVVMGGRFSAVGTGNGQDKVKFVNGWDAVVNKERGSLQYSQMCDLAGKLEVNSHTAKVYGDSTSYGFSLSIDNQDDSEPWKAGRWKAYAVGYADLTVNSRASTWYGDVYGGSNAKADLAGQNSLRIHALIGTTINDNGGNNYLTTGVQYGAITVWTLVQRNAYGATTMDLLGQKLDVHNNTGAGNQFLFNNGGAVTNLSFGRSGNGVIDGQYGSSWLPSNISMGENYNYVLNARDNGSSYNFGGDGNFVLDLVNQGRYRFYAGNNNAALLTHGNLNALGTRETVVHTMASMTKGAVASLGYGSTLVIHVPFALPHDAQLLLYKDQDMGRPMLDLYLVYQDDKHKTVSHRIQTSIFNAALPETVQIDLGGQGNLMLTNLDSNVVRPLLGTGAKAVFKFITNQHGSGTDAFVADGEQASLPSSLVQMMGAKSLLTLPGLTNNGGISNGNFNRGLVDFTSDYRLSDNPTDFNSVGSATLTTLAPDWGFATRNGPNGAGSKFLLVDGASDASKAFWRSDVAGLVAGDTYTLNFSMINGNGAAPARVQLYVNGVATQAFVTSKGSEGWVNRSIAFKVPQGSNPVRLELKDLETATGSNDFGFANVALTHLDHAAFSPSKHNLGLADFSSGYSLSNDLATFGGGGTAIVTTLAPEWGFITRNGPDGAGSKFMVVDGATDASKAFWRSDVSGLVAGEKCTLDFSIINSGDPAPARLQLYVNGVATGSFVTSSRSEGWANRSISFVAPQGSGPVRLELKDLETVAAYNDFGFANVTLTSATSVWTDAAVTAPTITAPIVVNDFSTDYRLTSDPTKFDGAGSVTQTTLAPDWGFATRTGPTGPGSKFLLVDGDSLASKVFWRSDVSGLTAGDNYTIHLSLLNGKGSAPARLQLYVNGVAQSDVVSSKGSEAWADRSISFQVPWDSTKVRLEFKDLETASDSNDFGFGNVYLTHDAASASRSTRTVTDFSTDYQRASDASPISGAGQIYETRNMPSYWKMTSSVGPTGPGSKFIQVDGASDPSKAFWRHYFDDLAPNQLHTVQFSVINGGNGTLARVQLYVNGVAMGDPLAPEASQGWVTGSLTFRTPASGPVRLEFKDLETAGGANDFCFGNVTLQSNPAVSSDAASAAPTAPVLASAPAFTRNVSDFSTDYQRASASSSITRVGEVYEITNMPSYWKMASQEGPAGPGSKFLQIDGGGDASKAFWRHSFNDLSPHEMHTVQFSVINGGDGALARVQLYVNGVATGDPVSPQASQGWVTGSVSFRTPDSGPVTLEFKDLETASAANDFCFGNVVLSHGVTSIEGALPLRETPTVQGVAQDWVRDVRVLYAQTLGEVGELRTLTTYQNYLLANNVYGVTLLKDIDPAAIASLAPEFFRHVSMALLAEWGKTGRLASLTPAQINALPVNTALEMLYRGNDQQLAHDVADAFYERIAHRIDTLLQSVSLSATTIATTIATTDPKVLVQLDDNPIKLTTLIVWRDQARDYVNAGVVALRRVVDQYDADIASRIKALQQKLNPPSDSPLTAEMLTTQVIAHLDEATVRSLSKLSVYSTLSTDQRNAITEAAARFDSARKDNDHLAGIFSLANGMPGLSTDVLAQISPDISDVDLKNILDLKVPAWKMWQFAYPYNTLSGSRGFFAQWIADMKAQLPTGNWEAGMTQIRDALGHLNPGSTQQQKLLQSFEDLNTAHETLKNQLQKTESATSLYQAVRFYASVFRLVGAAGTLGRDIEQASDQDALAQTAVKLTSNILSSLQVPVSFLAQSIVNKKVDGRFNQVSSWEEFAQFWKEKGLTGSLADMFKLRGEMKNPFGTRSIVNDYTKALQAAQAEPALLAEQLGGAHALSAEAPSLQAVLDGMLSDSTPKPPKVGSTTPEAFRICISSVVCLTADLASLAASLFAAVSAGKALTSGAELTVQEQTAKSLTVIQQIVSTVSGFSYLAADTVGWWNSMAGIGKLSPLGNLAKLETLGVQIGAALGVVSSGIDIIVQGLAITAQNVLSPVLAMMQDALFITINMIALSNPELAPILLAIEAILPNFQAAVAASVMHDRIHLIDDIAPMLGGGEIRLRDTALNEGYLASCSPFKALLLMQTAQYKQMFGASLPFGFMYGPMDEKLATTMLNNQLQYEPDFSDAPGNFLNAQSNFAKVVAAESMIFNFLTSDVPYTSGGSGLIDWGKYNEQNGGKQSVANKIALLSKLYQQQFHYMFNVLSGKSITMPNGDPISGKSHAMLTDIGIYTGLTKIAAPTHMYHQSWIIGQDGPVDLFMAAARMADIDKNLNPDVINAVSLGLGGESVHLSTAEGKRVNLYFISDAGNAKGLDGHLYLEKGNFLIKVTSVDAQKHMVLHAGEGASTLDGAREMVGSDLSPTIFLASAQTKLITGSAKQADTLGFTNSLNLTKVNLKEGEVSYDYLDDKDSKHGSLRYTDIQNFAVANQTDRIDFSLYGDHPASLLVTNTSKEISINSGKQPIVILADLADNSRVDFYTPSGEIAVNTTGNKVVVHQAAASGSSDFYTLSARAGNELDAYDAVAATRFQMRSEGSAPRPATTEWKGLGSWQSENDFSFGLSDLLGGAKHAQLFVSGGKGGEDTVIDRIDLSNIAGSLMKISSVNAADIGFTVKNDGVGSYTVGDHKVSTNASSLMVSVAGKDVMEVRSLRDFTAAKVDFYLDNALLSHQVIG